MSASILHDPVLPAMASPHDAADRPPLRVECIQAADLDEWDSYIASQADGSFFHTSAWGQAVAAAFGHEVIYLAALRGDEVVGALPLTRVRSLLGGTFLVSVPYAIYGGAICDDAEVGRILLAAAAHEAKQRGAGFIDLRSQHAVSNDLPIIERYVTFKRELPEEQGRVLEWLPRKARAAARNGRKKFGLSVRFGEEHLPTVWRLYCQSMHRLASLNYPYRFFEELVLGHPSQHLVSLVCEDDEPVAGLVSFVYGDTVLPYFVGATRRANQVSAFNFIYLTLAEKAVERGLRVFDFGRSRVDNSGSFNFKRFQGFEPTPLQYQCLTLSGAKQPDLTPSNPKLRLIRKLWPRLPFAVAVRMGQWGSKHVPG